MSGTTNRAPLPGLSEAEKVRHKGELVYPNLMLSCSADHVAAFVLRPLAVDRTRIDCSLLFARDAVAAADFDPSDAGDFWDLVNQQDWAICESVQRGMSSRAYTHGWFAPMEDDSADIRRWLLPRLELTWLSPTARPALGRRRDRARGPRQRGGDAPGPSGQAGAGARTLRARPQARRQPRHLADPAAQLPHAGLRTADPGGVRRLGRPRAVVRRAAGHGGRWARPVPGPVPHSRRSRWTTTRRRWTTSASPTSCSTSPRSPAAGRSSRCPTGPSASTSRAVPSSPPLAPPP